ncbi:MAG: hypothetical protein V4487_05360 [Chlamydiota bacterium]
MLSLSITLKPAYDPTQDVLLLHQVDSLLRNPMTPWAKIEEIAPKISNRIKLLIKEFSDNLENTKCSELYGIADKIKKIYKDLTNPANRYDEKEDLLLWSETETLLEHPGSSLELIFIKNKAINDRIFELMGKFKYRLQITQISSLYKTAENIQLYYRSIFDKIRKIQEENIDVFGVITKFTLLESKENKTN